MEQTLSLRDLNSHNDVIERLDTILVMVSDSKGVVKESVHAFFTACVNNLKDPSSPTTSKFYTVMILKQLTQNKQTKILSLLPSSQLFTYMQNMAIDIDPKKPVKDKGKDLFPKDPQAGNELMKIILECFLVWGQRFQKNKNKEPTRFKKAVNTLIEAKVNLPKQLVYFKALNKKTQTSDKPPQQQQGPKGTTGGQTPPDPERNINIASEIRFTFNKIEGLVGVLEDAETLEEIDQEIHKYHKVFIKYLKEYNDQQKSARVLNQKQEVIQLFFKIKDVLSQQQALFNRYIPNKQYMEYKTNFLIEFEKQFGEEDHQPRPIQNQASKTLSKEQPRMIKRESQNRQPIQKLSPVPEMKKVSKVESSKTVQMSVPGSTKSMQGTQLMQRQNKVGSNTTSSQLIRGFFQKMESRSRSPNIGFKLIKESLQKQKKLINIHPPRSRVNASPNSNSKMRTLSLAKSTFTKHSNTIFENPPNIHAPMVNYQGSFIKENGELGKILYQLKRQQGHRKFKLSNFRDRGILMENQHVQIGYKSEQIYQNVDDYCCMIGIDLYVGNKTHSQLKDFNLQFLGDESKTFIKYLDTLLYSNPKQVKRQIEPQFQYKHQLIIIPKKVPYHFMVMRVYYKINGQNVYSTVAIPNSILKLAIYISTPLSQISQLWLRAVKLRTQPFRLSCQIPPKHIKKEIPQLHQLTSYEQFSKSGSTTDYLLVCEVTLMETYEAILRINVRPDLKVVLQIGVIDGSEDAESHFKFYLESMQFLLSETE